MQPSAVSSPGDLVLPKFSNQAQLPSDTFFSNRCFWSGAHVGTAVLTPMQTECATCPRKFWEFELKLILTDANHVRGVPIISPPRQYTHPLLNNDNEDCSKRKAMYVFSRTRCQPKTSYDVGVTTYMVIKRSRTAARLLR